LKKTVSILLLLNFLVFISPTCTKKYSVRQLTSNVPTEEDDEDPCERIHIQEYTYRFIYTCSFYSFNDLFYLLSKERFSCL